MAHTYIITGANRGLGIEFVRQLRRRGETVIATVRDLSKGGDARALAAEVFALDVADESSVNAFASAIAGRPVDALINNAGVSADDRTIEKVSMAEFRRVFDTNAFGPAVLTRALLPNLRAGRLKRIVNISSTLGSIASTTGGFSLAYCASKAALNMITAHEHANLSPEGFTVVTMCPGWNRTDMGGAEAPLDPSEGVAGVLAVESRLTPADSGKFFSHEGKIVPW